MNRSYSIKNLFFKHFELSILCIALIIWIVGICIFKLPPAFPDLGSADFIFNHYLKPISIIMLIQLLITVIASKKDKTYNNKKNFQDIIFLFMFFMLVCFFHFTFKIWMPLVNTNLFDTFYGEIDAFLHIDYLISFGKKLNLLHTAQPLYHYLFVSLFLISFIYHFMFDSFNNFRKVLVGTALVLLLGAISYWICPAIGPFSLQKEHINVLFWGNLPDSYKFIIDFQPYQRMMFSLYSQLMEYRIIPIGYFVSPPAAMPSLHIANSLFLFFMMQRRNAFLAFFYFIFLIYLAIIAVASGWHYFIDLIFGALLAYICLKIADKVYSQK